MNTAFPPSTQSKLGAHSMIGILHIRDLQPRLPVFSCNARLCRISRYESFFPAKYLCHQLFKIPFRSILSRIQRTPIKSDSSSQKIISALIRTVLIEIDYAGLKVIILQLPYPILISARLLAKKGKATINFTKRSSLELNEGLSFLEKSLSFL